jgi:hypothetical protein
MGKLNINALSYTGKTDPLKQEIFNKGTMQVGDPTVHV